jgi:DNA-binding NarL/FixJ family response regulator
VLRRAYRASLLLRAQPLIDEITDLADRARLKLEEPVVASRAADTRDKAPLAMLTERELAVLKLVADGRTNAQIGAELYISPRTVGVHVSRILAKLHVRSRVVASAIYQRAADRKESS